MTPETCTEDDTAVITHHSCYSNQTLHNIIAFDTYLNVNVNPNTIHMYSGITSGRVLDGKLLYTKILKVNLN